MSTGGFNADSGSLNELIPMANLTRTKVISVLYRLAPEHPFPAAVDDTVAVYRELLKTYKPQNLVLYGTSAGAILTAEVAVKFKQLGLPCRPRLVFSPALAISARRAIHAIIRFAALPDTRNPPPTCTGCRSLSPSPIPKTCPLAHLRRSPWDATGPLCNQYANLLLSDTTTLHRAFLRAGVEGATGGL